MEPAGYADRLFAGIGPRMLRFACELSNENGLNGVVGLHALPTAAEFYRSLGLAELDCPNEFHELYFEVDEDGARAFMSPL